ncbi:MAG: hypothetical protein IPN95_29350 [Bacteroidetes bacterium]|nr:hypothetical protein [Bacteroidota bacterium]
MENVKPTELSEGKSHNLLLFTFIMEYKRGTYIWQGESESKETACFKWVEELKTDEIAGFSKKTRKKLHTRLLDVDNAPIAIKNCENVWCMLFTIKKKSILVNIIQTEKPIQNSTAQSSAF